MWQLAGISKALAALTTLTVMGWALHALILPNSKFVSPLEKLAISYLLGFAYLGWLIDISLLLYQRVSYWFWWTSLLVIPVAVVWRGQKIKVALHADWRWPQLSFSPFNWSALTTLCLFGVLIFQLVYTLTVSLSSTIGPDGLYVWAIKAKAIYLDSTVSPGTLRNYLTSDTWSFSHPNYPLTFAAVEAWLYIWIGKIDVQPIKLINACGFVALLTLLVGHLRRHLPLAPALLLACLLATSRIFVDYSTSGYADVALAVVFGGAVIFGVNYLYSRDQYSQYLCIILAACATQIKNDGTLMFIILVFFMCLALLFSSGVKPALGFIKRGIVVAAIIMSPRLLSRIITPYNRHEDFAFPSIHLFMQNRARLSSSFGHLLQVLTDFGQQGFIWVITGIFLLVCIAYWKQSSVIFLTGICTSYLMATGISYVFTRWPDYVSHIQSSLDRLVLQVAPVAVLLTGHLWAAIRATGKIRERADPHASVSNVL